MDSPLATIYVFGVERDVIIPYGDGIMVTRRKVCPEIRVRVGSNEIMSSTWHESFNKYAYKFGKEIAEQMKRLEIKNYDLIEGKDPNFRHTMERYPKSKEVCLERVFIEEMKKGLLENL